MRSNDRAIWCETYHSPYSAIKKKKKILEANDSPSYSRRWIFKNPSIIKLKSSRSCKSGDFVICENIACNFWRQRLNFSNQIEISNDSSTCEIGTLQRYLTCVGRASIPDIHGRHDKFDITYDSKIWLSSLSIH